THDGVRWEIVRRRENANGTTHHLFAAAAFNGRISAVGERGTLLQSDSANQWRPAELQIPRLSLNGIAFGRDGLGLIAGNRGLVLRTVDGGASWQRLKLNVPSSGNNRQRAR
ncbi:MAG TPA: YCF48-related protein, partial [Candidatus Binatia bacterium]